MASPSFLAVIVTTVANRTSARRAARSLLAHHGEARAVVVLVDDRFAMAAATFDTTPGGATPVEVRGPGWLASVVGHHELLRLAVIHGGDELANVLRPFVLRALLAEQSTGVVLSLPADAEVFASLASLVSPAGEAALTLVPSRLTPPPSDGKLPDAVELAATGRFDQELFALAPSAGPLLDEWCRRLARSAHVGPDRVGAGHPWLDDVATVATHAVLRDPAIGVTYRNADEPGRDGARLVRFVGFDPVRPWILSDRAVGLPRVLLSEHPWLAARCADRSAALHADPTHTDPTHTDHMYTDDLSGTGWDTLANGLHLDPAMRRAYLLGVLDAAAEPGHGEPPNPFLPGGTPAFLTWLAQPADELRPTSRYLRALHALRPDLRTRFADPDDPGPDGLQAWARINGRHAGIAADLIPTPVATAPGPDRSGGSTRTPPNGVNVVGFLRGELGVGEAARQLLRGVQASGVPHAAIVDRATLHRQQAELEATTVDLPIHRLNIIALNADALVQFAHARGSAFFAGRRTVGLWFWEVERFPERFAEAFGFVDEIWVATDHVRDAISAATDKPVVVVPLPLPVFPTRATPVEVDRTHFTVVFAFDYASVGERKNPTAAIAAYRRAFPVEGEALPDGRVPRFVLKSINSDRYVLDREAVLAAVGSRTDIERVETYLDPADNHALIASADCYLSLHRAEGWGLTMAEAMAAGVPVVATGYSGNLAFMNDANSWLVPFSLVPIPDHVREYAGCGRWAEPDIDAAARALRSIALDPVAAASRAEQGRVDVLRLADSRAAGQFIRARTTLLVTAPTTATSPQPAPQEATVDLVPPPSTPDPSLPATHPVLDHPGLGPVILPAPPTAPPGPAGLKGSVRGQIERAIKFEIDHRDQREHARAAAIVEEVSRTREAVRAVGAQQFADQGALTAALSSTGDHLRALQEGHDSLHAAVTEIGMSAHDSTVALGDVSARLTRIENRLDQLTSAIEALAARTPN